MVLMVETSFSFRRGVTFEAVVWLEGTCQGSAWTSSKNQVATFEVTSPSAVHNITAPRWDEFDRPVLVERGVALTPFLRWEFPLKGGPVLVPSNGYASMSPGNLVISVVGWLVDDHGEWF